MSDCHDTPTFESIFPELGSLLTRLGEAITAPETLALRDRITDALSSAGFGWADLVARLTGSGPAAAEPFTPPPPPPAWPTSEIEVDGGKEMTAKELIAKHVAAVAPVRSVQAGTVLTAGELRHFGYRQRGPGYGYDGTPVPDPDAT